MLILYYFSIFSLYFHVFSFTVPWEKFQTVLDMRRKIKKRPFERYVLGRQYMKNINSTKVAGMHICRVCC